MSLAPAGASAAFGSSWALRQAEIHALFVSIVLPFVQARLGI